MATLVQATNLEATRDDFYQRLAPEALAPLWKVLAALVTPTPRTPAVAAAWGFDRIRPLLMEAGERTAGGARSRNKQSRRTSATNPSSFSHRHVAPLTYRPSSRPAALAA